jgi:hypothetical protein
VVRLTYGVPGSVADLAREAGADLLRGDYCALAQRGLGDPSVIAKTDDGALLAAVGGDWSKVAIVRAAAERANTRRAKAAKASAPVLEAYIA